MSTQETMTVRILLLEQTSVGKGCTKIGICTEGHDVYDETSRSNGIDESFDGFLKESDKAIIERCDSVTV